LSNLFFICRVDMVQVVKRNDICSRPVQLVELTVVVSTFTARMVFGPSSRPVRRILVRYWSFENEPQYGVIHGRSFTRNYVKYAHQQRVSSVHSVP
jgi:hypothetical protein